MISLKPGICLVGMFFFLTAFPTFAEGTPTLKVVAAENTYHVRSDLDAVAGISYDWRHLLRAQDFVDPTTPTGTGTYLPA